MNRSKTFLTGLILPWAISVLAIPLANSTADNWPQWRGGKFDSISPETNAPAEIAVDKNLLWKFEMPGPGGASPVVWGDNVFVTTVEGGDNGDDLSLLCLSTEGKLKWKKKLEGKNRNSRDSGNSASPSPSTDGEHVWAMTANGVVQCFDMKGEQVWSKDLQEVYGKFHIQFGMTSTPVLDQGRLYFQLIHGELKRRSRETSVGWVIALDAKSGKEIWKQERKTDGLFENRHSYASPVLYRDGEIEFLVTHGGDYVIGHSLKDGSELWRCGDLNPKGDNYNYTLRFVSSPVCAKGMLVVPTAKSGPVLALKVDSNLTGDVTDKKQTRHWRMDRGTPDVATPVIYNEQVYLARENGVLICVDATTGEQIYQERLLADRHRSTPVAANGKVYIADRKGKITILEAGRKLTVLSTSELGEETLASPAISNGRVYVRTQKNLYAFGDKSTPE